MTGQSPKVTDVWCGCQPRVCICSGIPALGEFIRNPDLAQPLVPGHVIHTHLDFKNHMLCAHHERTGKTHTVHDVEEPQRLLIAMNRLGTAIALV